MKKLATILSLALVLFALNTMPTLAAQVSGDEPAISITPAVIRLDTTDATITVQTNVKYSDVIPSTSLLNGEAVPYLVKANSRGYLVAKFSLNEIRGLLDQSPAFLYFTVSYASATRGTSFVATQIVTVVGSNQKPPTDTSVTYTYPQTTYTYPQTTYTYPQTTYPTYTYPTYSYPTYVNPAQPYQYTYNPYYP